MLYTLISILNVILLFILQKYSCSINYFAPFLKNVRIIVWCYTEDCLFNTE